MNPATVGGARDVAKAGKLANSSIPKIGTRVIFEGPDGPRDIFLKGRTLWALRELVKAGQRGVTPIERVGPRWSDYA
ncbi:MAG: hypothetical protein AAFY47_13205 [Pseudomonadota bacterium]